MDEALDAAFRAGDEEAALGAVETWERETIALLSLPALETGQTVGGEGGAGPDAR